MCKNRRLLSMSLGRHRLGYAVFIGVRLNYYGLLKLKQFRTGTDLSSAVRGFLQRTLGRFGIDKIAVCKLSERQKISELLPSVDDAVRAFSKRHGIPFAALDAGEINEQLCAPGRRPTKSEMVRAVVDRHPQLARKHDGRGGTTWREKYYIHLFQAIAVGEVVSCPKGVRADAEPRKGTSQP